MPAGIGQLGRDSAFGIADDFLKSVRAVDSWDLMRVLMRDVTDYMSFRYFALLTHEDHRVVRPGQVNLRDYPEEACRRIIGEGRYRRDPVMRSSIFADAAYLWSHITDFMTCDHHDRMCFELGLREGLNEGITVPCAKHGVSLGSCTFAGLKTPRLAELLLGPAQMIGIFAFQRARQLAGGGSPPAPLPRLEPRHRDVVILAGQGLSAKVVAHRLGLTALTAESYLRDARRKFGARDKTELVAAAVLAGEIGLDELKPRQAP